MPVQIHYQCTLDDYIEANTGAPPRTKKGMAWQLFKSIGGWVGLGVAMLVMGVLRPDPGAVPGEETTPFPYRRLFSVMLLPTMLIGLWLLQVIRHYGVAKKPWEAPLPAEARRAKVTPLQAVLWIALAMVFLTLAVLYQMFPPALDRLPPYMEFLLPLGPLGMLYVLIATWSALSGRRTLARGWAAQPQEQESRTLSADEDGILIEQPSALLQYRWNGFAGYRETENLILLYISIYRFFIIPKRAFHDPEALFQFKGLVMSHVSEGRFLDSPRPAFPVLAAAAAEPSAPVPNATDPSAK